LNRRRGWGGDAELLRTLIKSHNDEKDGKHVMGGRHLEKKPEREYRSQEKRTESGSLGGARDVKHAGGPWPIKTE